GFLGIAGDFAHGLASGGGSGFGALLDHFAGRLDGGGGRSAGLVGGSGRFRGFLRGGGGRVLAGRQGQHGGGAAHEKIGVHQALSIAVGTGKGNPWTGNGKAAGWADGFSIVQPTRAGLLAVVVGRRVLGSGGFLGGVLGLL